MMTPLVTHALALVIGFAGGWLSYRRYGAKMETVRVEIKDTFK